MKSLFTFSLTHVISYPLMENVKLPSTRNKNGKKKAGIKRFLRISTSHLVWYLTPLLQPFGTLAYPRAVPSTMFGAMTTSAKPSIPWEVKMFFLQPFFGFKLLEYFMGKNCDSKKMFSLSFQGTNISPKNGILKMICLFQRWDMLIPWRVYLFNPDLLVRWLQVFLDCPCKQTMMFVHLHGKMKGIRLSFSWMCGLDSFLRYYLRVLP